MPIRYLLSVVLGTVLVFAFGGAMWAGGMYERWMPPMPGGDAMVQMIDSAAPSSGMYVYPADPQINAAANYTERENLMKARDEKLRRGPVIMMALTKGGQDPNDPKMLVRGFLI